MAQCKFCGRRGFNNAQSVRSHLKSCPAYQEVSLRDPKGPYREPIREPQEGGIAAAARDELEAERAKLDLRRTKAEHRRLDDEDAERARLAREQKEAAWQQAEAEALAREQARIEAEERRQREAAEAECQRERRRIIQQAKDRVDSAYAEGFVRVPEEVRAAMLAEVERVLSGMPVDELSFSEVVRYAEGVRNKHYRPVAEAHRRQEEEKRRRTAAKARLVAHGKRYLEDRLDAEGVQGFSRIGITLKVGLDLDRQIDGTESNAQVEELVETILAPELKQIRRQEAEREQRERGEKKRELISYGKKVASEELDEEGVPGLERYSILRRVEQTLEDKLTGTESQGKVEDLVDRVLDEELGEE